MATTATGKVGTGSQNDWKPIGTIILPPYESVNNKKFTRTFKKGKITKNTTRNDNECWNAGTPIVWKGDDISTAKPVTIALAGIPDMLVTRDPDTDKITEYHPVITFFNEVIAQIMRDGHRDWISNLEKEVNAIKVWDYLEKKYLKSNGKRLVKKTSKKSVSAKARNPVKKSKSSQKEKTIKKK